MEIMRHPLHPDAIDILMHVGEESYGAIGPYIREAKRWGISKKLPSTGVPEGIVNGISRIFLWYSKVIPCVRAEGLTLTDLMLRLINMNLITPDEVMALGLDEPWHPEEKLLPDSYVPPAILRVAILIQDQEPKVRREIEEHFQIEWQAAVFMWGYITVQYVTGKDGSVPQEILDKYGDSIDYVNIKYDEKWKDKPIRNNDEGEEE